MICSNKKNQNNINCFKRNVLNLFENRSSYLKHTGSLKVLKKYSFEDQNLMAVMQEVKWCGLYNLNKNEDDRKRWRLHLRAIECTKDCIMFLKLTSIFVIPSLHGSNSFQWRFSKNKYPTPFTRCTGKLGATEL